APTFLALPNVVCVGGSWLTPKAALAARNWDEVTRLARGASQLAAHQR
ncbi:MAG: 2-dehydro-3-deoxyphosphogluconate aldolase / (4S)-4-hydroxy-2-oxoglutarate aldolase, partial [Paraburkholderia sp.]|nr:2-dehydro-3-deoxyphosphogluconate aldolase / (4S)-4-hydroxy-2-oxoglutarate aldolase [Paraburkholderia sp.]